MDEPTIAQLADLPACSADMTEADVLLIGTTAFVAYSVAGSGATGQAALVRFTSICHAVARGPSAGVFTSHPYFSNGLKDSGVQEVVSSPWIEAISSILNSEAGGESPPGIRHFVLGLKESTVDILCRGYELVGLFPSRGAALRAAVELNEGTSRAMAA